MSKRESLNIFARVAAGLLPPLVFAAAPLVAQGAPVAITAGPNSAVETSIAIDPSNMDHIVGSAAAVLGDPRDRHITNFSYVTWDAGKTWTTVAIPNPEGRVQGDDAVTIDATGRIFHSYISFSQLRNPRGMMPKTGIYVAYAADGGLEWTPTVVVDHVNSIVPFEDKPYPVVDLATSSAYRGTVYIAWTRFTKYGSSAPEDSSYIYFAASRDSGRTFSRPFRIPAQGGDATDSDGTVEGAVPAVGPNGEVYLSWSGPRGIEFAKSVDGGVTWDSARTILDQPGGWDMAIQGLGRANGMPITGADISTGPYRGRVYVNWADLRNNGGKDGDADIFVAYSADQGQSWSAAVRVNGDPVGNGRDQFFPWMSVDPVDGSVNVVYYDRRAGDGSGVSVYIARSTDGGRTFTEHLVSAEPFVPKTDRFFGDYNGISAYGGRVAALWTRYGPTAMELRAVVLDFGKGER